MNAVLKPIPSLQLRQIPYWEVKDYWHKVGPMLQKVIDKQDEWSLQGIYEKLVTPPVDITAMQLWFIEGHIALITQINYFPQTGIKKCLIFMCGGENIDECLHLYSQIETWAIDYFKLQKGKDKMLIWGRDGWKKLMEPFGYKVKTICLEKVL